MKLQKDKQTLWVQRFESNQTRRRKDWVVVEEPLEIRLSWFQDSIWLEQSIHLLMRTPGDDMELTVGFLLSEGIIQNYHQIQNLSYCLQEKKDQQHYNILKVTLQKGVVFQKEMLQRFFASHSSCGICGKASIESLKSLLPILSNTPKQSLKVSVFPFVWKEIQKHTILFEKTGGVHSASLFHCDGTWIQTYEDIGRHNALDKLLGNQCMLQQLPLQNHFVVMSSRISFELVQKAIVAGVSGLVALGAVSSLAVELAQKYDLALVGFLQEHRWNLYSGSLEE